MIRRMLCLLCAVVLFAAAVPSSAEEAESRYSYDFDLTFRLNAESFPAAMRSRAAGYAQLADRLGLKGSFAWSGVTQCYELNATLYYIDKPSMSFPFRIFGNKQWMFCTSPIMNNAILFFNLIALLEYAVKAKNTLSVPLPYLAYLYPFTTERPFREITKAWQDTIGSFDQSGTVTVAQLQQLSELLSEGQANDPDIQRWISALAGGSEAPEAVEAEFSNLPEYYQIVTGGNPLTVTVGDGSEIWTDSLGATLFSREETDSSLSLSLSLPASANKYKPSFSFLSRHDDTTLSFSLVASVSQEGRSLTELLMEPESAESNDSFQNGDESEDYAYDEDAYDEDAYDEDAWDEDGVYDGDYEYEDVYYDYGETGDQLYLPGLLFWFSAEASGLPSFLPEDSSFALSTTMRGAIFPNFTIQLIGETKKDGSMTFSLCKPFTGDAEPVVIFSCSGTVLPAEPRDIPDYLQQSLDGVYNVFSFNEESLAAFSHNVLPALVRSLFSFVAEAPTAACQSFLDDLTDMGVLDMLLN